MFSIKSVLGIHTRCGQNEVNKGVEAINNHANYLYCFELITTQPWNCGKIFWFGIFDIYYRFV